MVVGAVAPRARRATAPPVHAGSIGAPPQQAALGAGRGDDETGIICNEVFQMLDSDKDGFVGLTELAPMVKAAPGHLDHRVVAQMRLCRQPNRGFSQSEFAASFHDDSRVDRFYQESFHGFHSPALRPAGAPTSTSVGAQPATAAAAAAAAADALSSVWNKRGCAEVKSEGDAAESAAGFPRQQRPRWTPSLFRFEEFPDLSVLATPRHGMSVGRGQATSGRSPSAGVGQNATVQGGWSTSASTNAVSAAVVGGGEEDTQHQGRGCTTLDHSKTQDGQTHGLRLAGVAGHTVEEDEPYKQACGQGSGPSNAIHSQGLHTSIAVARDSSVDRRRSFGSRLCIPVGSAPIDARARRLSAPTRSEGALRQVTPVRKPRLSAAANAAAAAGLGTPATCDRPVLPSPFGESSPAPAQVVEHVVRLTMAADRATTAPSGQFQECSDDFLAEFAAAMRSKRLEMAAQEPLSDAAVAGHLALQLMLLQVSRLATGQMASPPPAARPANIATYPFAVCNLTFDDEAVGENQKPGVSAARRERSARPRRKRGGRRVREAIERADQLRAATEDADLLEAAAPARPDSPAAAMPMLLVAPSEEKDSDADDVDGAVSSGCRTPPTPDLQVEVASATIPTTQRTSFGSCGSGPGGWRVTPPDGTSWEWPLSKKEKTVRLVMIQQCEIQDLVGEDLPDDDDDDGPIDVSACGRGHCEVSEG